MIRDGLIYPAPTIVLGVGRFGLATLERLAEDWQRLKLSSSDPSIKNLRLIHINARQSTPQDAWRKNERQFVDIARYTGDGDLPSLALDFTILRSLGLIRYREGSYQVAMPRDAGVVEKGLQGRVVRRRYFEWLTLHPDPIAAIERLELICDQRSRLDLFIRPIISRIKQGHSPRALLRCIARVRAYAEGRDPSPWSWFKNVVTPHKPEPGQIINIPFQSRWLTEDDAHGLLEGFAPEPVSGWNDWFRRHHHDWLHQDNTPSPFEDANSREFSISLPEAFLPSPRDLPSPLAPEALLRVDWETNGWATSEVQQDLGDIEFLPVLSSPFRLGLFDHDASSRVQSHTSASFENRLEELGLQAHRGLVRLWVDLQRAKTEDRRFNIQDSRRKDGVDDALRQTLEIIGELIVRPLLDESHVSEAHDQFPEQRQDIGVEEQPLPIYPSDFLVNLEVERRGEHNHVKSALSKRLIELGFDSHQASIKRRPLLHQVELAPEDLEQSPPSANVTPEELGHGLLELRHLLNQETRNLFDFNFLSRYRHNPTRRPPRLTVYVVGDVSDPFVRTSMRPILREIHAELLRSFSPIFESFREGFDRSLCVLPILWMPHPADAFGGLHPVANRCEEAAIIESIQGIRRWVETVPHGTRCIPQVFINSRVTDNAVLKQREAVKQTRDFMTFQIRNDLSRDTWLRRTVIGPGGDDFFASFACHEIEFPAERAREYLANKLARDMISQIKKGEPRDLPEIESEPLAPPDTRELLKLPTTKTRKQTHRAAESIGDLVDQRVQLSDQTSAQQLLGSFNDDFERDLLKQIYQQWRTLTRDRGEMDSMMNTLRRTTSEALGKTLKLVHDTGDDLVDTHASQGGLKAAQAGFNQIESITREHLLAVEQERQRSEEICRRHRIPQTDPVGSARMSLNEISKTKPDLMPMRVGFVLWAMIVPGLGAPLCYSLARLLQAHKQPGALDFILGTLAPVVGGLLLFLPAWILLRRHMDRIVTSIRDAVNHLAQSAREVVEGAGGSFGGSPSIRSFIEARLHMTATLNARNFALRVHENVVQDTRLAHRLGRSIDIQQDTLTRRAEDIGVRAQMAQSLGSADPHQHDDVSQLFSTRDGQLLDFLVRPEQLLHYYDRHYGDVRERQTMVPHFIEHVGGFSAWRKQACLSNTDLILQHTRGLFQEIVERPVAEQYNFEQDVGESLFRFVRHHYSNMGFGVKFVGYEGLDPDGVQVLCDASLLLHPALGRVFEEARRNPDMPPLTETLDVMPTDIIPNAAYMLSFAQGIRPNSVRNLMRFESFHDRMHIPDEHTFPMAGDVDPEHDMIINRVSGFEDLRDALNYRVLERSRTRGHLSQLSEAPSREPIPESAYHAIQEAKHKHHEQIKKLNKKAQLNQPHHTPVEPEPPAPANAPHTSTEDSPKKTSKPLMFTHNVVEHEGVSLVNLLDFVPHTELRDDLLKDALQDDSDDQTTPSGRGGDS